MESGKGELFCLLGLGWFVVVVLFFFNILYRVTKIHLRDLKVLPESLCSVPLGQRVWPYVNSNYLSLAVSENTRVKGEHKKMLTDNNSNLAQMRIKQI